MVRASPCHGEGRRFESDLGRFFIKFHIEYFVIWDLSSAGRASALQAEGHRFEPCRSHFTTSCECRSGGTGRRPGLKIPWVVIPVPVRFRSAAVLKAWNLALVQVSGFLFFCKWCKLMRDSIIWLKKQIPFVLKGLHRFLHFENSVGWLRPENVLKLWKPEWDSCHYINNWQ